MRAAIYCVVALGLAACGTDAPEERAAPQLDAGGSEYLGCPASVPPFEPGLTATDGNATLALVDADPSTPSTFRNEWTLNVAGASVIGADTFMPVHGHPGQPSPTVTDLGDGKIRAELYFTMRGPWEARFDVGAAKPVVFQICVSE